MKELFVFNYFFSIFFFLVDALMIFHFIINLIQPFLIIVFTFPKKIENDQSDQNRSKNNTKNNTKNHTFVRAKLDGGRDGARSDHIFRFQARILVFVINQLDLIIFQVGRLRTVVFDELKVFALLKLVINQNVEISLE